MATTTRLSFSEFIELPEAEGVVYELDEGELLMEASPNLRHNLVRDHIATALKEYVGARGLGLVVQEMDFRLAKDTVRNPDVAFLNDKDAKNLDPDHSPLDGPPTLAVEVVSPSNRADDMARKTHQYLQAGCRSVWVVYPSLRMVEIHSKQGMRQILEPDALTEEGLFPGLSIFLSDIFALPELGR